MKILIFKLNAMRNTKEKTVIVKSGRFKGQEFRIENELKDMPGGTDNLLLLASRGNWAARNAIEIDGYISSDAPFYYGKIGAFGYIISKNDLP